MTDLIATRITGEEAAMKEAAIIRRADRINKQERDLKAIGFDFSIEQVDAAINRQDALTRAKNVVFRKPTLKNGSFYGTGSTK